MDDSGLPWRAERAMDFGCGVGRLVVPLAKRFTQVAGVDIAEGMLAEAKKNTVRRQINNAVFYNQIPELEYDLVHSLFVLQHISRDRGMNIITTLWSKVSKGGILAIQLPIYFSGKKSVLRLRRLRNVFPLLQIPYNVINGNRWNKPGMQMNIYDINLIVCGLQESGVKDIRLYRRDSDDSFRGVYMLASKEL